MHLDKEFDRANKEDMERLVGIIQGFNASPWTKHLYKVMLKRFYKWLKGNDEEYPPEVKWIRPNIKKSEEKLPAEGELITEEEIKQVINTAKYPRDKALVSMLYESGCRVGELATLKLGNIVIDNYGIIITIKGKTGSRKIRLIASTPYLATWLQNHPRKEDKDAPLWIGLGSRNEKDGLKYDAMRILLNRLFKRAKVQKKCNPHFFRHSRATYMANHLTEFQMNQYFGWIQGSRMPAVYVHLTGKDTEGAIFELNGIKTDKEIKESSLKPKKCFRCETINPYDSKFCSKCAGILDMQTALELEEKRNNEQKMRSSSDEIMNLLTQDPEFREILIKKLSQIKSVS